MFKTKIKIALLVLVILVIGTAATDKAPSYNHRCTGCILAKPSDSTFVSPEFSYLNGEPVLHPRDMQFGEEYIYIRHWKKPVVLFKPDEENTRNRIKRVTQYRVRKGQKILMQGLQLEPGRSCGGQFISYIVTFKLVK